MTLKSRDKYGAFLHDVVDLLETARRSAARSVNSIMTATYWYVGRRIVEQEQSGKKRAEYGKELIARLSRDLSLKFGRGFSPDNIESMRLFYQAFPHPGISETMSRKSDTDANFLERQKSETVSRKFNISDFSKALPLSWSHYVRLIRFTRSHEALEFYHNEALRGGWTVRQLDRRLIVSFMKERLFQEIKIRFWLKDRLKKLKMRLPPKKRSKNLWYWSF